MTICRSVSVMVAAYNEAASLEGAVSDVLAALDGVAEYEIIIVDDGSSDGTAEVADRLAGEHGFVRVIHHPVNRGIAAVYRSGLEAATKQYFTWVGGDREIAAESVRAIVEAIGHADLVIPYHGTPEARAWHRRLVTWFCTQQINVLFGWSLHYYQGPTVYPRELALRIPVESQGFFFASEMLIRALSMGLSWVEVGLRHQDRQHGTSNAVKPVHLLNAQFSVLVLWLTLRLGLGRAAPQPSLGTVSNVGAICDIKKELGYD
jgi:glycosyltransferase involved in cell wall biosynthesis